MAARIMPLLVVYVAPLSSNKRPGSHLVKKSDSCQAPIKGRIWKLRIEQPV